MEQLTAIELLRMFDAGMLAGFILGRLSAMPFLNVTGTVVDVMGLFR